MSGFIDIVCNLYTPVEVRKGQTGIDEHFKKQVRMTPEMRKGISIPKYLKMMDEAGIEHSLLIAVRCGDMNVKGSFNISYQRVASICKQYPDRFSGLAISAQQTKIHVAIATWEWGSYFDPKLKVEGIRLNISSWRRPAPNTIPWDTKASGL